MRAQIVEVSGPGDFEAAFAAVRRENTESILLPPEPLIRSNRDKIGGFAQTQRLPLAVVGPSRYLPTGGLLSYGPTGAQYSEITARYIDRILKGTKPGDIPVEEPARFELTINLKTARMLGLTIPQSIQLRADEKIE
jgi:putative ABC transport system substrate-binding protein